MIRYRYIICWRSHMKINKKQLLFVLAVTFIVGFTVHGFCYFNGLLSHDSLLVNAAEDYMHQFEIGRFMQPLYTSVRGTIIMPSIIGVLQLLFIGLMAYAILDLLEIKNKINQIIIICVLVTNYTVSLTNATYICCSDIFALANLLSVLSVYLYYKNTNKYRYIICILLMVMSLGLYQSGFQVGVALCMIVSIRYLLINDDYKKVLKEGAKVIVLLIASLLLYITVNKMVLIVIGAVQSDSYNSIGNISKIYNLNAWIKGFKETIAMEYMWFIGRGTVNDNLFFIVNSLLFVLSLVYILRIVINCKFKKQSTIVLVALIILAPIGFGIIGIMSFGVVHDLMIYSYFLTYVITIMLIEIAGIKVINIYVYILIVLLLFSNVTYANTIYMKKYLECDATLTLTSRIIYRIESIDEYIPGNNAVVFVGNISDNNLLNDVRPYFDRFEYTGLYESYGLTYYAIIKSYIVDYLGYPMNILDKEYAVKFAGKEEVKNMPLYPNKGSIEMIDGVVVVKLG